MTQSSTMTLYHYWRSSCSWRVRWAMDLKKVTHALEVINLLEGQQNSSDFLVRNPSGAVPCLKVGSQYFAESLAILEYLEELFPEPSLFPNSPLERLRVRQLANIIVSGTQPLQNLMVQRQHSSDPEKQKEYAQFWIGRGLSSFESVLQMRSGSHSYSWGSQISLADICLIPQCYNALRFGFDLSAFPLIQTIYQRAMDTEACRRSAPDAYAPS
ncbi:MAG: maleylacetoacetate isomerase [Oligoflexales bacterium]|nr:maleylacetoacetate isomerase [Oligoflexales bacterium]